MRSKRQWVLVMLGLAIGAHAGSFPEDFQAAVKLYRSGKNAEAEEAFVELSARKVARRGADASLARAAYSAQRQKKSEKADEYAAQIKDPAMNKLSRMELAKMRRDNEGVLAICAEENFDAWPDELIYPAYISRGDALARLGRGEEAVANFRKAMDNTVSKRHKASALYMIGNTTRDSLKDPKKAMDAYGEIVEMMWNPKPSNAGGYLGRAMIERAKILSSQGKGDEALAELKKFEALGLDDPYWLCALPLHIGQVQEAMGNKDEALKQYRQAAAIDKGPAIYVKQAKEKIAELEASPADKEKEAK